MTLDPPPSKIKRLFLGIPLSQDVSRHLEKQLREFPGRIIQPQNWHLTLHFLGAVEDERLLLIHNALQSLPWGDPFELTFDHLGAFPHPKRAHNLWVGIGAGNEEIQKIIQLTGDALTSLGFTIDPRPYVPHLTVRRFSLPHDITKLIETHPLQQELMKVDGLILYESILNEGPTRYVALHVYKLGKAPSPSPRTTYSIQV